ncbi:MAG TPA: helix-turn-helix domain-containing protein [Thermoplasmata archaeon]|nr:helix-turn-helix domain-containing protein [Thermoplasmata archaeon]
MPSSSASPARTPRSAPARAASPEDDIERSFSDFRESAVRLVERVNDLLGPSTDPAAVAQADLKIVRSIFGKWSADVLLALHSVPSVGFEELRRSMPGISPRVLSLKLKELEQNGMVQREIIDTRPPRVRYSLTQRGWTVAWLAQPIFLFLRITEPPSVPETDGAPVAELAASR